MTIQYHNPVLLDPSIEGLNIRPDGVYVDVTFGGGGHSKAILNKLNENGRLFGFDQDSDAASNIIDDSRFEFVAANFSHLTQYLKFHNVKSVDGILADFGVSSHQFDQPERGFSIRFDALLDMRMNQQDVLSAHSLVNSYDEEALRQVFWNYGELRTATVLAKTIVQARELAPIDTTFDLKTILKKHLPHGRENKILAQIYQAIRIEVNQEIEVLKVFLLQTPSLLKTNGRLSIISYHSLEDRLVKRFIRNGLFEGEPEKDIFGNFEVPLKKVGRLIIPTSAEIKSNNRARSAKLRVVLQVY